MADEEKTETDDPTRADVIAALRRERAGYVQRSLKGRVAEVDAELKRLGVHEEERTQSAPRETAVESKPRRTAGRGGKPGE